MMMISQLAILRKFFLDWAPGLNQLIVYGYFSDGPSKQMVEKMSDYMSFMDGQRLMSRWKYQFSYDH